MSSAWLTSWVDAWRYHAFAGGPEEENKARARTLLAFFDEHATYSDVAAGSTYSGTDEIADMLVRAYEWCPNLVHTPLETQASDGKYCIEWEMKGTRMMPVDGTEREATFSVKGVSVGRFNEFGKVTAHDDYWNALDWMKQTHQL